MKKFNTPILPKLTYTERVNLAPAILDILKSNADYYLTNSDILSELEDLGLKCNGPKIRKIINYLRCMTYPIVSNKTGYCLSTDDALLIETIIQLQTRIDAMTKAKEGLLNNIRFNNEKKKNPDIKKEDLFVELDFM